MRIRGHQLAEIGLAGPVTGVALNALPRAVKRLGQAEALAQLRLVVDTPGEYLDHPYFGTVAARLVADDSGPSPFVERMQPAPFRSWCDDAEQGAIDQMHDALRLPSAVRGALMPDAHPGYGLPIGGVLATEGTVIPYAVGVDIACRMKLTVFDLPASAIDTDSALLERALLDETQFGSSAMLRQPADHDVLDEHRWTGDPITGALRDRAASQLGTSGSGNHFVEFGTLELARPDLGLAAGTYLALLSHSGSRGPGARIANHYSKIARDLHPGLPPALSHLAWLDLDTDAGRGYWNAMQLMGAFAAACHEVIHTRLSGRVRAAVLAEIENHHNFAWLEQHDGRQVVVHRKGATPAGEGVLGIIPGSMATPGYVVRGRGSTASLDSASHGAGRVMSRSAARNQFTWAAVKPLLDKAGVRLLGAGIDENPLVYKDIERVVAAQVDLVDVVARFHPRIVRMADGGGRRTG